MIVTDKEYFLEKRLVDKLDLMIKRSTGKRKFDNLIIVDGDEGYGKSNCAVGCAYYVAHQMKRPFSVDNLFFDINKMIEFAQSTKEQVIIWDEAALAGLASEWQNKSQKMLIKLMMAARKKRHFYFFNIPKFYRLHEYLAVERSIALIHVYARDELKLGRFVYFKRTSKENLYSSWKRKHLRSYKKFYNFSGSFLETLPKLIDEKEYDRRKDEAIASITTSPSSNKEVLKLLTLQYKISQLKGLTITDIANQIEVQRKTIYSWADLPQKYPEIIGNEGLSGV